MSPIPPQPPLRLRSVFISDVHLGFKGCRAGFLLDFLRRVECQQIYLVGDIIDLWSLERTFFWPQQHNDVIRTLFGKAKHGTRVVYIPGNHDRLLRDYVGWVLGNVEIRLESLGNRAYSFVLRLNRHVSNVRQHLGYPYWSLAAFLKHRVKNEVKCIANFERAVAFEARRRGVDGVICGHIRRAEVSDIDGVVYCNDGDWVESCTALVEDASGQLSLLRWTENVEVLTDAGEPLATPLVRAA
jgi:UDP-2,3-diacylglucosamine pyrophosphatase LpxH